MVTSQEKNSELTPADQSKQIVMSEQLISSLRITTRGDDSIDAINHMMSFLSAVDTSRYPTTNNQLRNLSNPRQQATINDGRVTLQPVQGRQISFATGKETCPNNALNLKGKGMILDPRVVKGQATQTVITHNAAYKVDDLDAYDSDCDELNTAKVSLMANLSHVWFNVLHDSLRKLKGKDLADNVVTKHTIAPEMLKVDVEPITPKLLNNRTAHSDYLRHTWDQAVILREVVEQGKSQNPLNNSLDSALKSSTSANGSQPYRQVKERSNIQPNPSSTQKNKVEAHPRTVKSSLKNKNSVVEPKGNANVQHSKLNVKFRNDHVAKIMGYGDYQIRNVTTQGFTMWKDLDTTYSFSVGQFCDLNLEVAFHQHTYFIRNLEGVDLLTGSLGNNLYTLSLGDMMASSPYMSVDLPAPEVIAPIAEVVAPEPAASTGSPSSTTVNQDAPSPSNLQTTLETQSYVISIDVEEENHDLDVAHMNNDPFFGIPIPENNSESSLDVIPTIVHTATPNSEHVTKWTKDHPLDNIIR
ncbi:hypothetical protein Tco_0930452 [Tanacetum coccineum]